MENSVDNVVYYLLDLNDDWDSWSENQQESLAMQTLQEWICSERFKLKASHYEIECETTLGRRLIECKSEDQYWKDSDYHRIRSLMQNVYEYWCARRWVYVETTRNGRPRRAEYSRETVSKAKKYAYIPFFASGGEDDVMYRSVAWSKSVLGETNVESWVSLVTVKESVFKYIFNICGVEYFSGCTKDELAEKLKLPKKFISEMCRWLVDSGNWVIVRANVNGQRRREIRYTVFHS